MAEARMGQTMGRRTFLEKYGKPAAIVAAGAGVLGTATASAILGREVLGRRKSSSSLPSVPDINAGVLPAIEDVQADVEPGLPQVDAITEPKTPAELSFIIGENVPVLDREIAQDAISNARVYFDNALGLTITEPVEVHLSYSPGAKDTGVSGSRRVSINTGGRGWTGLNENLKRKLSAHELMHAYQGQNVNNEGEYDWVTEGIAEYAGYAALVDSGRLTQEEARAYNKGLMLATPSIKRLENFTPGDSFVGYPYALAYMAIDRLVGDRGMAAVGDYLRVSQTAPSFRDAFSEAFGMSVDVFEQDFAQHRASLG